MATGTYTTIETLAQKLLQRWVPKWFEAFSDNEKGGFYERLGHAFQPVPVAQRRLLTQCRQLALYSHAVQQDHVRGVGRADVTRAFESMMARYYRGGGNWRFAVAETSGADDDTADLYALSFVIFSLSHYFRATQDIRAREMALETLDFINTKFRMQGLPGFAEALGPDLKVLPRLRRQNPHMHLLEACLFAASTWDDPLFMQVAGEMVALFFRYFYDEKSHSLHEFFTDDLRPDPEKGNAVEPGHYFEWVWLLKSYARAVGTPSMYDETCRELLAWANRSVWDSEYGGIYDTLDRSGRVIADTKRLWPFAEALKAHVLMLDCADDRDAVKARLNEMVGVFQEKYMDPRGFWTEWLKRDLTPATDYMPGTTPYHVYFGIMEAREAVRGRGRGQVVSLRARILVALYTARRFISSCVKTVRLGLKNK